MTPLRITFLAAAAFGLAVSGPVRAQEAEPATEAPAAAAETPAEAPSDAAQDAAAADGPAEPAAEIEVTRHGDWEVGCLAGTPACEMQQVAKDAGGNPVVLVRVVKLPADAEAPALAIFNTPLGTLLPTGLSFRIDQAQEAALPFDWCVQEGCIVRLGLREADVNAMKRGRTVQLRVVSIADPEAPVELTLSLTGFTAAYDSMATPPAPQQ